MFIYRVSTNVTDLQFEDGYDVKNHDAEIRMAKWLGTIFGGTIILLREKESQYKEKRADFLWDGKYWELKNVSSSKTVDSALRKAIRFKQ